MAMISNDVLFSILWILGVPYTVAMIFPYFSLLLIASHCFSLLLLASPCFSLLFPYFSLLLLAVALLLYDLLLRSKLCKAMHVKQAAEAGHFISMKIKSQRIKVYQ